MTVSEALRWACERLERAGVPNFKRESELLIASFLGSDLSEILLKLDKEVPDERGFKKWVARRSCREPLQYIVERAEFYGFSFKIEKGIFIPRPETELLVEEALRFVKGGMVLDLGTGCGNIILSLLATTPFRETRGIGVDLSKKALRIASVNAELLNLKERVLFIESDWGKGLREWFTFDVIVSNPPYIPQVDLGALDPEVILYEPLEALLGGEDGLLFYRKTLEVARDLLKEGGKMILEIDGKMMVDFFLGASDFKLLSVRKDYSGRERIIVLQKR
ncbi:MAG: peptide chain release factor N(5)-glutamine methyltransferase [Synergistetes bacterium]|nr:peptide chain release factor N(5)-glutamine methyltransferase [Synergistota bacterium]